MRRFDLDASADVDLRAALVISLEVAEHLPESCADRYVDLLTSIADVVLITAAPPGQGGTDHVNEQPPEYWMAKLKQRDFELDEPVASELSRRWKEGGAADWYWRNVMLFRRCGRA